MSQSRVPPALVDPVSWWTRLRSSAESRGLDTATRVVLYAILAGGAVFALAPLVFLFFSTFKTQPEQVLYPPVWIPSVWTLEHYRRILLDSIMPRAFLNSVVIAGVVVLGNLVLCTMAGYAFAKLEWLGREAIFVMMLFTMMVPAQLTIIPSFLIMKAFGWIDTWAPLIVPSLTGAFGIFLMRQYLMSIPDSLLEAARVDGNTEWGVVFRVVIPVCKPPLLTLGLLTFQSSYNDLLAPLIYLKTPSRYTVPLVLAFFRETFQTEWGPILTASFLSIVPLIVAFSFLQQYFVQGLTLRGMK